MTVNIFVQLLSKAIGKSEEGLGGFTFLYTVWFYCVHLFSRAILFKEMLWDQLVDLAIGKDDIQLTEYFHAL